MEEVAMEEVAMEAMEEEEEVAKDQEQDISDLIICTV